MDNIKPTISTAPKAGMTTDDINKAPNGRFRIGKGLPMYKTMADAEAALSNQQKNERLAAKGKPQADNAKPLGKPGKAAPSQQGEQMQPNPVAGHIAPPSNNWKAASVTDGNTAVSINVPAALQNS